MDRTERFYKIDQLLNDRRSVSMDRSLRGTGNRKMSFVLISHALNIKHFEVRWIM